MDNVIKSPSNIAGSPKGPNPSGNKEVNGEPGYTPRTKSSGPAEVVRDNPPGGAPKAVGTDKEGFGTY